MTEPAVAIGDSQAEGLMPLLGAMFARHGYALDASKSWSRAGAGIDEITQHAVQAGPAKIGLIFTGGANDPASLVNNAEAYRAKLQTLVGTMHFAGVQDVFLVGPFKSDDPAVAAQHQAARLVQGAGIPGARFIDGIRLSEWTPHPDGNLTHWTRAGYQQIVLELERAVFQSGTVTAIGLVGTLTFLGGLGMLVLEAYGPNNEI